MHIKEYLKTHKESIIGIYYSMVEKNKNFIVPCCMVPCYYVLMYHMYGVYVPKVPSYGKDLPAAITLFFPNARKQLLFVWMYTLLRQSGRGNIERLDI